MSLLFFFSFIKSTRILLLSVPAFPVVLWIIPPDFLTPYIVGPILFLVALSVLLNFPNAVPSLQKRPLYLQDIVVEDEALVSSTNYEMWKRKRAYYHACRLMVNISSAVLVAGFCEYGYNLCVQNDQPKSYMEVAGVVGGVLALLNRTQSVASRIILKLCRLAQDWDERRRRLAAMSLLHTAFNQPDRSVAEELNTYFLGVV